MNYTDINSGMSVGDTIQGTSAYNYVVAKDDNGCSFRTLTYPINFFNACHEISSSAPEVSIFPNPANQIMMIQSSGPIVKISILNTVGQCVYKESGTEVVRSIQCSDWAPGLYLINFELENHQIVNKKLSIVR